MSSKMAEGQVAPGHPGITARWTSSSKSGVGTAVSRQSRVWFTVSHGIINEVYYPNRNYMLDKPTLTFSISTN